MSAMTGPRHSPSSTWQYDTQNQQLAGVLTPTGHLSTRDPNIRDGSGFNYFSISVNDQAAPQDPKQGFSARNDRDAISQTHSSISSQRPQLLPRMSTSESGRGAYSESEFGSSDSRRGSVFRGLPWNPDPSERAGRDEQMTETPQLSYLRPQDSMQQKWSPPLSLKMPPQVGMSNIAHQSAPEVGAHSPLSIHGIQFASPERCAELLSTIQHEIMVLDLRPFTHFAQGNISGSLNLCIPTTLLKRPSFDTQKLQSTFTDDSEKKSFARWRQCRYIIVYDATTADKKDAGPLLNVLKKFVAEGWNGDGMILSGGFRTFAARFPRLTQQTAQGGQSPVARPSPKKPTSMHINLPAAAPVAGGCAFPESSATMIPFFGNIRQNTDLVGGVGQLPVQLPKQLTESKRRLLPTWLRDAANATDKGHNVSQRFLKLEQQELERMKHAFSYDLQADNASSKQYRIAGIEMGTKNRYNDIYPFEHSRVQLQNVPTTGNDYVNASHLKTEYSNKRYIATQAPVPDTFNDFWRVVWEQDVRLIVTLTAEAERGHVKCHPYWESGNYGQFRVNNFSQRPVSMDQSDSPRVYSPRPSTGEPSNSNQNTDNTSEKPCIIVRHFGLSHSAFPFQPLREVIQLQYPYWPDFGTTSQPSHLLQLIEQCEKVKHITSTTAFSSDEAEPQGQRPILVHCSAGCGRTGTFCTVDSVLDMLKRQRSKAQTPTGNEDPDSAWIYNDEKDLVAKAVADFRTQRPSMIQNLSQYVLCYESLLEWVVAQLSEEDDGPEQGGPLKNLPSK